MTPDLGLHHLRDPSLLKWRPSLTHWEFHASHSQRWRPSPKRAVSPPLLLPDVLLLDYLVHGSW